jgi:hypothetical protein
LRAFLGYQHGYRPTPLTDASVTEQAYRKFRDEQTALQPAWLSESHLPKRTTARH